MRHLYQPNTIPDETVRVARTVFRRGNSYMTLRDQIGQIFQDDDFAELFDQGGRRGLAPGMLALVLLMQYMEGLTDRQAAEAVRSRIDWKYALGLALTDSGFSHSRLSDFRERLIAGGREAQLLTRMLAIAQAHNLLSPEQQRTDATQVVGAVRQLNRVELVGETVRQALEALAAADPAWLQSWLTSAWVDRYEERVVGYRLPDSQAEREALAWAIGQDGWELQQRLEQAAPVLQTLPAVAILRQIWEQQYAMEPSGLRWRGLHELPPTGDQIVSPFEWTARHGRKRQTSWVGYKVHLTETCQPGAPQLITNVKTTNAAWHDSQVIEPIQQDLQAQALAGDQHLVDAGYVTADTLLSSQRREIDLIGPIPDDTSWQARSAQAFALADFQIDWVQKQVRCPGGATSQSWRPKQNRQGQNTSIHVRFAKATCAPCSERVRCTTAATRGRCLTFQTHARQAAIEAARERQHTDAFRTTYKRRIGIEATISTAVRCFHLRRSRFRGLTKTHLHHLLIAAAVNLTRLAHWWAPTKRQPYRSRLSQLPLLT